MKDNYKELISDVNVGFTKAVELLTQKINGWFEGIVTILPNLFVAVFVMLIFYTGAKFTRRGVQKLMNKLSISLAVKDLTATIAFLVVLFLGIFTSLGILKLDKAVTSLLAGAGVIGLALGFAFQDIASNFVSGIFIAFAKPYKIGDVVQSGDYTGTVTAINLRTTTITTFGGLEVLMPNRFLFTDPVVNYTNIPRRRLDFGVGVSYGDDLDKVEKLLLEGLEELPNRIEREKIQVHFEEFGDSSINLFIRIWVHYSTHASYLQSKSEAVKTIKRIFDANDICIPFPIRTLDFGIKGGEKLSQMGLSR